LEQRAEAQAHAFIEQQNRIAIQTVVELVAAGAFDE
jgi:hypothetical protein